MRLKRVYEPAEPEDGYRILVDRLWPRGVSKDRAQLDEWLRAVAPSTELRKSFGHDPVRWEEFERRYRQELAEPEKSYLIGELAKKAGGEMVTLLFAAKDQEHNEALVLKKILDERLEKTAGR